MVKPTTRHGFQLRCPLTGDCFGLNAQHRLDFVPAERGSLYATRKEAERALRVFGKQDAQIAACEIVEASYGA